jgi:hypothetical protein
MKIVLACGSIPGLLECFLNIIFFIFQMLSKVVFALLLAVTLGFPTERVSNHIENKLIFKLFILALVN